MFAFSVDFGIERDIIKKINKLKRKMKGKGCIEGSIGGVREGSKDGKRGERSERRRERSERKKKREEDEEEEEEEKTNDPAPNVRWILSQLRQQQVNQQVRQLMSLVGGSEIQCHRLLESNGWNLACCECVLSQFGITSTERSFKSFHFLCEHKATTGNLRHKNTTSSSSCNYGSNSTDSTQCEVAIYGS